MKAGHDSIKVSNGLAQRTRRGHSESRVATRDCQVSASRRKVGAPANSTIQLAKDVPRRPGASSDSVTYEVE